MYFSNVFWVNKLVGFEVCLIVVFLKGNFKIEIVFIFKMSFVSEFYDVKGCFRRIICYFKVVYI